MVGESAIVTPAPSGRWPRTVVARETARRGVRSAVLWGVVFGVYVTESATGYEGAYKTSGQRHALAQTLGSDVGISAIIGPASHLDTVSTPRVRQATKPATVSRCDAGPMMALMPTSEPRVWASACRWPDVLYAPS